ncbi:MAG: response regulator transcription factor [Sporichthyaceae bacterium]|jgi:two-component system OmpR family response regulator
MRLLLVQPDAYRAKSMGEALRAQGYAVDVAGTATEALSNAVACAYDVVLVEVDGLLDGAAMCRDLRGRQCWAPILVLAAAATVADVVRCLDAGADDFVRRPIEAAELFARLRAITRRDPTSRPVVLRVGDLSLDPACRRVERAGTPIELSAKEFALLEEFMRHPGVALTRAHLIAHVWDFAYDGGSNVVDVYVRYLRDKVDRPFDRETIRTVRAVGYRLDPHA